MGNEAVPIIKTIFNNIFLVGAIAIVICIIPSPNTNEKNNEASIGLFKSFELSINPCSIKKTQPTPSEENFVKPLLVYVIKPKDDSTKKDESINKYTHNPLQNSSNNVRVIREQDKTDEEKCIDIKTIGDSSLFFYTMNSCYGVSANMTSTVIESLTYVIYKHYPSIPLSRFGVLFFYLLIITLIWSFSKFINKFLPINLNKKQKKSFIIDIVFSILGIISVLYVICLIPTIMVYIGYLLKCMVADGTTATVKGLCFILFITALMTFLPIMFSFQEGAKNKKNKSKKSKKRAEQASTTSSTNATTSTNATSDTTDSKDSKKSKDSDKCGNSWSYLSLLALFIPIIACVFTLVTKLFKGPHEMPHLKEVGVYGLVVLLLTILLEIFVPTMNELFDFV